MEHRAELLLIDDRDGAIAAREHGLTVTGTLGVLDRAAALGWLDLPTMFARLRQTTFRSPHLLMANLLPRMPPGSRAPADHPSVDYLKQGALSADRHFTQPRSGFSWKPPLPAMTSSRSSTNYENN